MLMVEKGFSERSIDIQFCLGSGIGATICAITANDARQALQIGQIQRSSVYQQTKTPS
jgi:hypothetical protein